MKPNLLDYIVALNFGEQDTPPQPQNLPEPQYLPSSPMAQVNPFYTRPRPYDAFAPMAMYQQYKQTGQIPQAQSSFVPWSAQTQSAPTQALPTTQTSTAPKAISIGGK